MKTRNDGGSVGLGNFVRKTFSDNPLKYLFGKTWKYSEGNRRNLVWIWIMFIVANSIPLFARPLVWAKIINVITTEGINMANIRKLLILLSVTLFIEFFHWCLHGPARVMERVNAFKVRINYRRYLMKGVMTLPMEWHVEHHSGDTIDRIEKGTGSLFEFSKDSFVVIYSLVQLVGSLSMLLYFSPSSAYIVFPVMFVTALIVMRFDKIMIEQYRALSRAENAISESVFDAISNITTVIILRVEKLVFDAIMRKVEKPLDLYRDNNRLNEIKWFITSMCNVIMTILVVSNYFWQNLGVKGGVLVGSVYLLINYLDKVGELLFNFTSMYGEIVRYKARIQNSEELTLDFKSGSFANHVLPSDWSRLEIQDLNFSYHGDGERDLNLNGVNMMLRRGERIALIGKTGSGKTTLLKIIRDLYHPQGIKLSVDSNEVSQGFGGISRAISLVPQDPEIFATTIRENITLGAEHGPEIVQHYMDMASFTEVALRLPRGLDTSIKEKGVNLSGGQKQRLALARGLLASHDKEIVLLDEPTNGLDSATEMDVYRKILDGFKGKTIISTVHRLHLLPLFDKIYLFENGRIISCGTLCELLANSPEFRELWAKSIAEIS